LAPSKYEIRNKFKIGITKIQTAKRSPFFEFPSFVLVLYFVFTHPDRVAASTFNLFAFCGGGASPAFQGVLMPLLTELQSLWVAEQETSRPSGAGADKPIQRLKMRAP